MATQQDFTHLHLHSQYSLLDGAIRMDDLVPLIKAKGMHAVAVTDHGNMYGALHFYKTAKKHGIKPIIGCETYVASNSRHDRNSRDAAHLVLLAKNNEGYKNLSFLVSMGFMEGFYYNPRIDKALLKQYSKGLYGLSACLGGVVNKCLFKEGAGKAADIAREYQALFEPGHFFLELQSNGLTEQTYANQELLSIARTYNIPVVATADSHYLRPQDSAAHEVLMCIGQGRSLQDFRNHGHHSDLLYVRSAEEMWESLGDIAPDALENTVRIANSCDVTLDFSETFLPSYGVPAQQTRESYLEQLAVAGLQQRCKEAHYNIDIPAYKQRLDFELGVITNMGFAGYFLIVWDFIRYAKEHTIPVGPGRGSGAGSLVAWCLRITDLDPIPYDLLFERFLNPERISMPDFDIDFCQDRRQEVIDYVSQKYGSNNVGQIVTHSQLSAKSVIKDVGRVLELPFAEVNALTKLIPGLINGKKVSIEQALELEPKLRDIQQEKPIYAQVINIARALEGLHRQTGIHAAGIVIGDKPLWEYIPVCRGKAGEIVTQLAKDEVEEVGLVKFDFLGLKTLTVIAHALHHVKQTPGDGPMGANTSFNIENIPLNDANVYNLIGSGTTDGVFQMESSGFKELLKRLKPDCFEDIVAAVALYRPGPLDAGMVDDYVARKHHKKKVIYPHPVCEAILKPTYGVIVYQEQVMRIAVDLCGFSMGQADVLRKAMGKKKSDVMAQMREQFVNGAHATAAMKTDEAADLFAQIEKFAGYAFNKSHSAAYAVISYQTAYLKTYYPVQFTAALLSTEMGDQDNIVRYIQSARADGILICGPCVNRSGKDFSVVHHDKKPASILFGLGAVKGVGDAAIESILHVRDAGYTSLYDFCERVDLRKVNRRVLEALVRSGACDMFSKPRAQLFACIDKSLEAGQKFSKDKRSGQISLFAMFDQQIKQQGQAPEAWYPDVAEWSQRERLRFEKESLGFYISGHPLDAYVDDLHRLCSINTDSLKTLSHKNRSFEEITICGVVSAMRERPLKNGSGRMAFIVLEDLYGSCEVLLFSKVFAAHETLIKSDEPILIKGVAFSDGDNDDDDDSSSNLVKIRATLIESLSLARIKHTKSLQINIPATAADTKRLQKFKKLLNKHHGQIPVIMTITQHDTFVANLQIDKKLSICPTEEFLLGAQDIFGRQAVKLN